MRLERFFAGIQKDLKLFGFLLLLLCLYRAYFIWYMASYMGGVADAGEVGKALWTGLRLSLKSAGALALPTFVLCTLPCLLLPRLPWERLRLWWGMATSFVLAVLFQARFPYYREFHATYDLQVLQGWNDDRAALFWTMVQEYGLPWRLALAVLLAAVCWRIWRAFLHSGTYVPPVFAARLAALCADGRTGGIGCCLHGVRALGRQLQL